MSQRGLASVMAMARPMRSEAERAAVQVAFADLHPSLSDRAKARLLARRVVAAWLTPEIDGDPLMEAFTRLQAASDPAFRLAHDPDIDLAAAFRRHRLARYDARGCRQLAAVDWEREGREIADLVEKQLAERFRRA